MTPKVQGEPAPRAAWLMLGIVVFAYLITIMQRTSFGVVGLQAADRFATSAGVISLFAVLQLGVYAIGQVPAGFASDRFGTRAVMGCGALLMLAGQLTLAFTHSIPLAIFGRVLVALGDAGTWTPIVRLIPNWFPARLVPVLTQSTAMVGMSGQILSAVPFVALVRGYGWTTAFTSAAAASALAACVVFVALRNRPAGQQLADLPQPETVWHQIAAVLQRPGTQLAFWGHWMASSWSLVFMMLWGYPYLEQGQGRGVAQIGTLFSLRWLAAVTSGVTLGYLTARYPMRRSSLIIAATSMALLPWLVVLSLSEPAPLWLLAWLVIGIGIADPGSGVGFDIVRTTNPDAHRGTATGVVVMGGFTNALLCIGLIGVTLDLRGGGYTFTDFRIAMSLQLVGLFIGMLFFFRARRRARALESRLFGTVFLTWPELFRRIRAERRRRRQGN